MFLGQICSHEWKNESNIRHKTIFKLYVLVTFTLFAEKYVCTKCGKCISQKTLTRHIKPLFGKKRRLRKKLSYRPKYKR